MMFWLEAAKLEAVHVLKKKESEGKLAYGVAITQSTQSEAGSVSL